MELLWLLLEAASLLTKKQFLDKGKEIYFLFPFYFEEKIMSLDRIYSFVVRAFVFATVVTLIYIIVKTLITKKKKIQPLKVLLVFYLASLWEITAIRGVENLINFRIENSFINQWQLVPLITTFMVFERNIWTFIYFVAGNILWFLPLGILLPLIYPKFRNFKIMLLTTLAISLLIELSQWFLSTGVSDIDDIIFNVMGGIIGYLTVMTIKKRV